jgi:hypothetical protein
MASNARNLSKLLGTSTQVPTTALPPAIADLETVGQTLSGGEIAPSSIKSNTLTQSFDSNQAVTFNMADSIDAVSPIVSVFKEVPVTGVTSKGQWDVNANATNYEFYDEKPYSSYASSTLTPSATGDGTFTSSNPTVTNYVHSKLTTNNSGLSNSGSPLHTLVTNAGTNDNQGTLDMYGVWMSPAGDKILAIQVITNNIYRNRLHGFNVANPFSTTDADITYQTTGNGYYDIADGTTNNHRNGTFGIDPTGTHLYTFRNNTLYQYVATTGWEASTFSFTNNTFVPSGNGIPPNYDWQCPPTIPSNNGDYLLFCSANDGYVARYTMTTAWDCSTCSSKQELDAATLLSNAGYTSSYFRSAQYNSDGTLLLLGNNDQFFKLSLSTPYDITTASFVEASSSGLTLGYYGLWITSGANEGKYVVGQTGNTSGGIVIQPTSESLAFSSADVGKKVVGNSGSAIITATSGTYTSVTPFADTSAISSWQLFGAEGKSDGSGIVFTQAGTPGGIPTTFSSLSGPHTVSGQTEHGFHWSKDGTYYYIINQSNTTIYRYICTTPWDATTISAAQTLSAGGSGSKYGITVSEDGKHIYHGTYNEQIVHIPLSTSHDLTTAGSHTTYTVTGSYSGGSNPGINPSNANPWDMWVNSDGTKIWSLINGVGTRDTVIQFSMSTAYDISTASYENHFTISPTGNDRVKLTNDGSRLYVTDNNTMRYWNLSPAYTLPANGTSPTNITLPAGGGTGKFFNEYYFHTASAQVNRYTLDTNIENSSTTPAYSQYFPALTNSSTGQINSSAWQDINSMTADETKNGGDIFYAVSTDNRTSWGVAKASDGVRKIVKNNSGTWQYNNDAGTTVSVGYDLSNASYTTISPLLAQSEGYEYMHFKPDGTKVWVGGQNQDTIYEYDLSTGFDLSTISYGRSFAFSTSSQSRGFFMKSDGTRAYISDYTGTIYQLDLSTAWDITTASYSSVTLSLGHYTKDIYIKSDGTKLYNVNQNNEMKQFTMSTPWDLSTATLDHTVTLADSFTYGSITFNSDGTILFIAHVNTSPAALRAVNSYSLSTAWDISSTLTLITNYDIFPQIGGHIASGIDFNTDGSKMYIISAENTSTSPGRRILEYSTGGTNIGYATSETWVNGTNNNEHATLQEALGAQSFNRMNKAQLDAVADGYHFSQDSADTLDLMIAPYAASGTSPISDGVTINYDAEALIREAIPGTDYIAEFPNPTTLNITAVGAANLKIRAQ